ncbi:UBA domain-containing protein 7 [Pleurostoma richardsiae]|uniref:UBA domain-containing protein 7 n=1 Tax=Pleurostoma richardsiae TaxID=41990 RepID=A0AA38R376_9PEZI|nr:UBA domain-containing protein 7 [Pleurostoma richardsiae]
MDDLSGLDWSNASQPTKPPPMTSSSAFYPSLRATSSPSISGRNTPLSSQASGQVAPKVPAPAPKVAPDSFSNLMTFGSGKSGANLSLREKQERLEAEKRRKEDEKRKQAQANYGDGQFWDALGHRSTGVSRTASPAIPPPATSLGGQNGKTDSDDDLFAAFKSDTKVDNASHYPPPSQAPVSGKSTPSNAPGLDLSNPSAWTKPVAQSGGDFGDDDDPFGLGQLQSKSAAPAAQTTVEDDEDDDLLGDLGKPVDEVRRKKQFSERKLPEPEPGKPIEDSDSESTDEQEARTKSSDPFDKAVAQLVDWGFTPENARRGLTESGAGLNVQAAVNWLLDDAHRQAKEKARAKKSGGQVGAADAPSSRSRNASPAWIGEDGPSRRDNRSPAVGDDLAKTAAAMGTSFLKTANSLWKTGQKRVQKAVAELQQDGDPNQPRWMRSVHEETIVSERGHRIEVTDEAMMLEAGTRPERGHSRPTARPHPAEPPRLASREHSPALSTSSAGRSSAVPKWQQQAHQPSLLDPRARLSKQAIEEQSSQAYVSPARRKKATPQPPAEPKEQSSQDPDLLFTSKTTSQPKPSLPHRPAQASPAPGRVTPQPPPPRKVPTPRPARQIPALQPAALQTSTRHRQDGTSHFKRGDFAAAHASYSSSLAAIPREHPLAILLLCNRALTALKTGEPRQAVSDADAALELIGPSKGEGEYVQLHDDTGDKRDMKELYGKALTRKAEALEQMEKWADASAVWQLCVESGVGGPTAIAGRQRCQKALAPKPAPKPPAPAARSGASTPAARSRPAAAPRPQKDSEAVEKLRAANEAAARADDEKFALADKIDARVSAWRDGKRDNLRALLGSLDQVLWENSGWKKVGMHELVVANKVKVAYMKAIAKTHPDKLPQDASTEVRMIAGIVFATLNESWDKFKAENGM